MMRTPTIKLSKPGAIVLQNCLPAALFGVEVDFVGEVFDAELSPACALTAVASDGLPASALALGEAPESNIRKPLSS